MNQKPAIQPRPKTITELRQIQRDLYEMSKPYVELMTRVLGRALPTIRLYHDGRSETIYDAETVQDLETLDRLWTEARESYLARIDRQNASVLEQ